MKLWSHWCWEMVNYVFIFSLERDECEGCIWNKSYKNCGNEIKWRIILAVVNAIYVVLIRYISYTSFTFISFTGDYIWTHDWPTPNISGVTALLVRASHRYREVTGSNPVEVLIFFSRLSLIAYKRLQGNVPAYLNNLLWLNSNIHSRQNRYCNVNLTSPRYNRQTEGGRTSTITTCKAWNSSPLSLRQRDSFKQALWNEFFTQQQYLDHFLI